MIKFSLLAIAALLSVGAFAKGSSHVEEDIPAKPNGMILFKDAPRVKIFGYRWNTRDYEGGILVCQPPNKPNRDEMCVDNDDKPAWWNVERVTPAGFKILGYEYRIGGSYEGYKTLIIYYTPK